MLGFLTLQDLEMEMVMCMKKLSTLESGIDEAPEINEAPPPS